MSVIVRKASALDIPFLQAELETTNWEKVDLNKSLVWVAEYNGIPIQFAALRIIWQLEPICNIRVKGIPNQARRQAMWLLVKAVEEYLFDPEQNRTGIYAMFAHTTLKKVWEFAKVKGWHRVYKGGWLMIRWFGSESHRCEGECCKKAAPQRLQDAVKKTVHEAEHQE